MSTHHEMYSRFCLTCTIEAFHLYFSPHLALLMSQATLEQHLAEKAVEMQILQEHNDRLKAQVSSLQQQLSSLQMAPDMQDVGHMHGQQHSVLPHHDVCMHEHILSASCAVVVELQSANCLLLC